MNSVSPSAQNYTMVENGMTVSFQAKVNNGTLVNYAWNFGDGNTSVGAAVNHTYVKAGTYNVILTATTPDGRSEQHTLRRGHRPRHA